MEGTPDTNSLALELKAILSEILSRDADFSIQDRIAEKAQQLRAKYQDYDDYEMYHLFAFSTMTQPAKHFDFPGEDSVADFIRSL